MPYNLLILPLAGGYYILLNFIYFKYNYQRLSSQRILFNSVIAGIVLLGFTFFLRQIVNTFFPFVIEFGYSHIQQYSIPKMAYFGTCLSSLIIAVVGTHLLNWFSNKFLFSKYPFKLEGPLSYAVKRYGDEIERLFRESAINGELMQLTLKNGKVYIGFSATIPSPQETNYLTISPVFSGYRKSDSQQLILTTDYSSSYRKLVENEESGDETSRNIDIVIKQDEILTVSLFDIDYFKAFKEDSKEVIH